MRLLALCALCALLPSPATAAEPVQLFAFDVEGSAEAVLEPLARRLDALGAHGDLVVRGERIWLVASTGPTDLPAALASGTLRLAPVVEPDAERPTSAAELAGADDPTKRYVVDLGRAIEPAVERAEGRDDYMGLPVVLVTFDAAGAKAFFELSRALVGQKLAIVLGDAVMSAPVVREAIAGGRVQIALGSGATIVEARALAAQLGQGQLPTKVSLVIQTVGQRTDNGGRTVVTEAGAPLIYATPKRWHPGACALFRTPGCGISVVRPGR